MRHLDHPLWNKNCLKKGSSWLFTFLKCKQVFLFVGVFLCDFAIYVRDDTHMTAMETVQFSRPPNSLVYLHPNFFHSLDLGRPISNKSLLSK